MKKKLVYISVMLLLGSVCYAIYAVRVHNKTDKNLWGAIYYYNQNVKRATNATYIPANSTVNIPRPKMQLLKQRRLLFDTRRAAIKPEMSKAEFNALRSKNIGIPGDYFIGVSSKGPLRGYHYLEWKKRPIVKAIKQVAQGAKPIIQEIAKQKLPAVIQNPYKNQQASVRVGNQLQESELNFLNIRKPIIKNALQSMLNRSLDDASVPKISFIMSGGGYRAMISTLGFLVGAQKIGLLDAITYISSLSGSTWALGTWIASGLPIQDFQNQFVQTIGGKGLGSITRKELGLMIDALLTEYVFDQRVTAMDLFGVLLANRLLSNFGDRRQIVGLSEQVKVIESGKFPFPIYTAIDGRRVVINNPGWYEFTPYEVGSAWLGMYVPTWAFGRKFIDGKSIDFAPEQSLGVLFATFGSAFSVNVRRIWEEIAPILNNSFLESVVQAVVSRGVWEKRWTFSAMRNFTFGMENSPIEDIKELHLVDAGFDMNLPYPPLSGQRPGRQQDILIFLDASDDAPRQLQKAEQYARNHNQLFPKIDYTNVNKRTMSIFKDETNPNVPVVIYMPIVNDPSLHMHQAFNNYAQYLSKFDIKQCLKRFCSTANFKYTVEQMQQLMTLTEFNMIANKDNFIEIINWVVQRK